MWRCKPCCLDWNKDGLTDLVTLDHQGYLCLFQRSKMANGQLMLTAGQRIFNSPTGKPLRFGEGVAGRSGRGKFDLVDWDDDGDRDLLAYEFDTHLGVAYFQNVGSDTQPILAKQGDLLADRGVILAAHSTTPCAVDANGDEKLDLLVGAEDGLVYFFHRAFLDADLPKVVVARSR